jgi:hypothetical protein
VDEDLLLDVLQALDLAVIERLPNTAYFLHGREPGWLTGVFDAAPAGAQGSLAGALPFLDHFLNQAEAAWYSGPPARAESGPFAARVGRDDLLLRATALTLRERMLLILERLTGEADTRSILQTARENLLAHERLTRHAAAVHEPAAALARLVAELGAMPATPELRAAVDRLGAASASLQASVAPLPQPPKKRRP